jgi:ABC-type sugar transport system substrate-binding protein
MTMITAKTLMLAGFAALSLGAGTAMAQEGGGPSMIGPNDYWTVQQRALYERMAKANHVNAVQSGVSDLDTTRSGAPKSDPNRYQWGTLANPG